MPGATATVRGQSVAAVATTGIRATTAATTARAAGEQRDDEDRGQHGEHDEGCEDDARASASGQSEHGYRLLWRPETRPKAGDGSAAARSRSGREPPGAGPG